MQNKMIRPSAHLLTHIVETFPESGCGGVLPVHALAPPVGAHDLGPGLGVRLQALTGLLAVVARVVEAQRCVGLGVQLSTAAMKEKRKFKSFN